jgi:hypothetical protein
LAAPLPPTAAVRNCNIVDTVGIKVGRHSMIGWYDMPHTEPLHVAERYRPINSEAAKDGFARDAKEHNVAHGMRHPNDLGKYLEADKPDF